MKHLIYLILFAIPTLSFGAVANIDHIIFVSEPQTVLPDTISKVLTIQSQNSAGAMEALDETADLTVSVTSVTGEFNSNATTWNPATTFTMSKSTGNKNFYYQDSTVGTYTISATLTTRTTGKSWTATQEIIVSDDLSEDDDTATTTTATSTSSGGSSSTHYIQEEISTYSEPKNVFELSAGRNRLGNPDVPLLFEAKYKISKDLENKNCKYLWTFGDGSSDTGEKTDHVYKYKGNYNLVLNGDCGSAKSVSRSEVSIVDIDLVLAQTDSNDVSITNKSEYEINLGGWKLTSLQKTYSFPVDTILAPKQEIVFPKEYTGITNPWGISLINPINRIVVSDELARFIDAYRQLTLN
jgi:hypothetical protein